jgi:hypothetical protein
MPSDLANLLATKGIDRKHAVLLTLAATPHHLMPKDIRALASKNGFQRIKKWNVSQLLADLKGCVARYEDGWAINDHGKSLLSDLGLYESTPTKNSQLKLREHLLKIADEQTRDFVSETVRALEYGLLRSAIVLSWIGAVSLLHGSVLANHLASFNLELAKRYTKKTYQKN